MTDPVVNPDTDDGEDIPDDEVEPAKTGVPSEAEPLPEDEE